jgi:hypothetical protein
MIREIAQVKWVRRLQSRPDCIPCGRPRGTKAQGVKYEEALAALPHFAAALRGVWFEFSDASGNGFAQLDFLFSACGAPFGTVVAEAKLTWTPTAYLQLRKTYFPLLRALTGFPVGGIVVCQNLTRETPRAEVTEDLAEALRIGAEGRVIPTLHVPALPQGRPRPSKSGLPPWWRKGATPPPQRRST